ncbi:MAG: hypothetical protein HN742_16345 [Lentisphaerae bacterium]|jgi:hypothetical protein|nr:hypothetical protein [Lentisphaerota bacterium]MBT4817165.1 hypothetical protein [Lentisphaerota bacterium]MBT5612193.1 hypothetical protein [Lentisphaerota bacterium]MBT7061120.1 hypothetical protein [Lentisphaerota bacterium]MBT7843449.1 hypothetical protein [Lentisphaerota bacterium]
MNSDNTHSLSAPGHTLDKQAVLAMYREMAEWLGRHQVDTPTDTRHGSLYYPTEDRYCNRDTACAASAFMQMAKITGDAAWQKQAAAARDYVLRVQGANGGFPELRGLEDSDGGSAVNTSIIATNLIRAYQRGLPCSTRDVDALVRMADFILTLEWKPGAFYHDTNHAGPFRTPDGTLRWGTEGSGRDCHNTTALSAAMLRWVSTFVETRGGTPDSRWNQAADRAVEHLLDGQNEDGHWPYWAGATWHDVGHHGMCIFHLTEALENADSAEQEAVVEKLLRGAEWLLENGLLPSRKGTKIDWAVEKSACVYFTHGYFAVAAPLARLAALDPHHSAAWHHAALELLRYVRTTLWDNADAEKEGPFRLTEAGLCKGYAWFGQSMGWCLYLLDDLIGQLGWWT